MSSKDVLVNINSSIICFLKDLNHRIQNTLPMKLDYKLRTCLIRFVVSKVVLSTARLS
jgi:hypothetical protein